MGGGIKRGVGDSTNENLWHEIILGGKKGLALGVVYLAAGRDPASVAWNDRLLKY